MTAESDKFVEILEKLEAKLAKVDQVQGSRVKLPKAEIELLQQIGATRDALATMLGNRSKLPLEISAIARIRIVLESIKLTENNSNDSRVASCMKTVESCEMLAKEGGVGGKSLVEIEAELREAQEKERRALSERKSGVRLQDIHAVVSVRTKLEKVIKAQRARKDMVPHIVAETDLTKLLAIEPNKHEALGAWMTWMVHRVYLNDPSLDSFDFSNLQMPTPVRVCAGDAIKDDRAALLAPKLVQALATNTNLQVLQLANSNLQGVEARELGEALKKNVTLRRVNIDSNVLAPADLELVILGLKENTSVEEFRCNNQLLGDIGRSSCAALEALLEAVQTNTRLVKLGLHIHEPHFNNEINKQLMKNNMDAKAYNRRLAATFPASEATTSAVCVTSNSSRRSTKESLDEEEKNEIDRLSRQMAADFAKEVVEQNQNSDTSDNESDAEADNAGCNAEITQDTLFPSKALVVNIGDDAIIKALGQQGKVTMTNGHAHKVCGKWYLTEELEIETGDE